jgi:hypothetical protein
MAHSPLRAPDVFIPNSYPELTYVERGNYEQELRDALRRTGSIVSLTGRSKSGKTVLATRVIGSDRACIVGCANTPRSIDFWQEVLRGLGVAQTHEFESGATQTASYEGTVEAHAGLPLVADLGGAVTSTHENVTTRTDRGVLPAGSSTAVRALRAAQKTLVVDDFHYLQPRTQRILGRQLKDAAYRGVPVVILSVPHHGDDPVRAVPDLVGRVQGVQLESWNETELRTIADKGFEALGYRIGMPSSSRLARESIGSPQLMQLLCLETCLVKGIDSARTPSEDIAVSEADVSAVMARAARAADFTTLFRALQAGPRQRGRERTMYPMADGSSGDVYHVVLAALSQDPLLTTIPYETLKRRVQTVCSGEFRPTGTGIQGTIEQLSRIAREQGGTGSTLREPAIEWLSDRGEVVLPDAYFLFYLRWQAFPRHDPGAASGVSS